MKMQVTLLALLFTIAFSMAHAQTPVEKGAEELRTIKAKNSGVAAENRSLARTKITILKRRTLDLETDKIVNVSEIARLNAEIAIEEKNLIAAEKLAAESGDISSQQSLLADFFSKDWGIGLAIIKNRSLVVSDASLDGAGIVRANTSQTWVTELVLAKHFYFRDDDGNCNISKYGICWGPFLGVGIGGSSNSQLIDFVGTGVVFGIGDKPKSNGYQTKSHSIGIGLIGRRFGVKTLGDGQNVNQVLPAGETQIRYTTKDISSPFLFYTYQF